MGSEMCIRDRRKLQKLDQSKVIASIDLIDSDKADVKELSAPEVSVEDR